MRMPSKSEEINMDMTKLSRFMSASRLIEESSPALLAREPDCLSSRQRMTIRNSMTSRQKWSCIFASYFVLIGVAGTDEHKDEKCR